RVLGAVHAKAGEALGAEGCSHRVGAGLRPAVVSELEVSVRGDWSSAWVADLERDIDHIAVAPEGIDLLHLEAVLAQRGKPELDCILPGSERTFPRQHAPR